MNPASSPTLSLCVHVTAAFSCVSANGMAPSSMDPGEPERRARDDANGADRMSNFDSARSPNSRHSDNSSRRAKDWRRDRPSGSFQRDGDQNRTRGYRDERSSGKRERFDHKQINGNGDKLRRSHDPGHSSSQAKRADAGWGKKGKERARDAVESIATPSLASRLDGGGAEARDKSARVEENRDEEEDEEARQRRIRRLKRRRRSAGLDSDVDDDELFAFEKTQLERVEFSRNRKSGNADEAEERYNRKRQSSPRSSEKDAKRQRDNPADRADDQRSFGRESQGWSRRDSDRGHKAGRDSGRWPSENEIDRSERHVRRDEHQRRSDRGDNAAWQRRGRRVTPTLTDGSQSDDGSSRAGTKGRKARREESERDSPDARILRRRRSRTRSPEQQVFDRIGDGRRGADEALNNGNGRGAANERQVPAKAAELVTETFRRSTSIRARPDEIYERIAQVGEGTYGQVFKAKASRTGVIVALKKIRMESEKDGFPITAMREVKLLQGLRHENVVRLHEMMLSKNSIYMVFEYLQHDLNGVLAQSSIEFTAAHLKSLAAQLLAGLAYLHAHSILHRDLKCSNLLLNNEGTLKLADFGLARSYTKQDRAPRKRTLDYTNRVVTLWYRAPELLFGETSYGDAIDVWGAGCIFLELFARKAVFQGNDEIHQVQLLFALLGPVRPDEWPEADTLSWYNLVRPASDSDGGGKSKKERLRSLLEDRLPDDALDVAVALLAYNPRARLSAHEALRLPYFTTNHPHAQKPASLLQAVEGEWHEFESRRARRNAAAQALHAHVHREREEQQKEAAVEAAAASIAATSNEALLEGEERGVDGDQARAASVNLTPLAGHGDVSMDDGGASA